MTYHNCRNKTSGEKQPDAHSTPCQERDPEVWFPPASDHDGQAYAKALCTACPVIVECLDYALSAGEDYGVWGGMTEDERRAVRRKASRNAVRTSLPPEQIRTKAGNPVQHGTLHTYKRYGCSCLPCRDANAEYAAQRRARERAKEKATTPTSRAARDKYADRRPAEMSEAAS